MVIATIAKMAIRISFDIKKAKILVKTRIKLRYSESGMAGKAGKPAMHKGKVTALVAIPYFCSF